MRRALAGRADRRLSAIRAQNEGRFGDGGATGVPLLGGLVVTFARVGQRQQMAQLAAALSTATPATAPATSAAAFATPRRNLPAAARSQEVERATKLSTAAPTPCRLPSFQRSETRTTRLPEKCRHLPHPDDRREEAHQGRGAARGSRSGGHEDAELLPPRRTSDDRPLHPRGQSGMTR